MYEFPSFVYLDVEKSGSTFIFQVLGKFSAEEEIQRKHHAPMPLECDRSKFYFISVRDPLDSYISLYSFGCGARGKMRVRFERRDLAHFYDGTTEGFNKWLQFTLKIKNRSVVDGGYADAGSNIPDLMGPQSYRYLRLAIPGSRGRIDSCETKEDVRALYEKEKLPAFVVRYENFVTDLSGLLRGPLRPWISDVDEAVKYVETSPPRNSSDRVDKNNGDFTVRPRLREKLRNREWLLAELFGYGE
jgi:hypothetical protein